MGSQWQKWESSPDLVLLTTLQQPPPCQTRWIHMMLNTKNSITISNEHMARFSLEFHPSGPITVWESCESSTQITKPGNTLRGFHNHWGAPRLFRSWRNRGESHLTARWTLPSSGTIPWAHATANKSFAWLNNFCTEISTWSNLILLPNEDWVNYCRENAQKGLGKKQTLSQV